MMKNLLKRTGITAAIAVLSMVTYAQVDIILDPSTLTPADTGYYYGGIEKDKDGDGNMEFYNGCFDEYGDASHNEAGLQQGFTYNKSMIMPTCYPKDCYPTGDWNNPDASLATVDHAEGYIQLSKTKYPGTDSAILGYIISPPVENLVSLTLETSCDVSSNDSRKILWWIEISKDGGENWEFIYIEGESKTKTGDLHTFDETTLEFADMITASQEGPIVLRLMTKPLQMDGTTTVYQSQRLKVHYMKIVADEYTGPSAIKSRSISDDMKIEIRDGLITIENETFEVYNTLGQFIGKGKSVQVNSGVYILRTESGATQKVLVK